ncbi:MAG: efflux RND transporter periplasmic adaptor subunit [Flavobacteriales bacterium]
MNRIAFILAVVVLAACSAPTGPAELDPAQLQAGLDRLDSLDQQTWSAFNAQFAEREQAMFDQQKALQAMDRRSNEYATAKKELADVKRTLIEEEMDFLNARKAAMKQVSDKLAAMLGKMDEKLIEIDTTRLTPEVSYVAVGTQVFKDYFRVQGNLEAEKNALVFPEYQGVIKSIPVREGQRVSKGQALMVIDTEIVAKQIAEVETSLALAEDLYIRQKNLWDQNIGSEVQYLEVKNRMESLENSLATLKEQRSKGTVRAPFAGVLDEITPKVGEMASPGMPVARVVNLGDLYVQADVSEKHFGQVQVNDEVLVNIQGVNGGEPIAGHVSRVGAYIKPDNRTFSVRVDFDQKRTDLIPNLVTELLVNEFSTDSASVVLPADMVLENATGDNYVWVLEETPNPERHRVARRIIQTGPSYNDMILIVSGLQAGEHIVDRGVRKVKNGDLVKVMNAEEPVAVSAR